MHACTDEAYAVAGRGRRDAELSIAASVIAGAALLTSAILYARSAHVPDRRAQVAPMISPGAAGMAVVVGF